MPVVLDPSGAHALSEEQPSALWKWRWLGLSDSTPAFKASLALLAAVTFALVTYALIEFA